MSMERHGVVRSDPETTTRWCPVCEGKGIPIVWGYPSENVRRLADEGRVIIAGCMPIGIHPSHGCASCGSEFIATDRIYRREVLDQEVLGIGVWPHGRRPVRVEDHGGDHGVGVDAGWTVVVAGEGSMLIEVGAARVFFEDVFEGMSAWQMAEWVRRRGFDAVVQPGEAGSVEVSIHDQFNTLALTLIKTWWRALGRNPVPKALGRLGSHVVWLPGGLDEGRP
jgi:hypothetical protein